MQSSVIYMILLTVLCLHVFVQYEIVYQYVNSARKLHCLCTYENIIQHLEEKRVAREHRDRRIRMKKQFFVKAACTLLIFKVIYRLFQRHTFWHLISRFFIGNLQSNRYVFCSFAYKVPSNINSVRVVASSCCPKENSHAHRKTITQQKYGVRERIYVVHYIFLS